MGREGAGGVTDIAIRKAGKADRDTVRDFARLLQDAECAMHPSRRPGTTLAPAFLDELYRRTRGRNGAILLAEADGRPVGYIAFYVETLDHIELRAEARRFLYVSDMAVVPHWRGRGVAGRLLAEAEAFCRQLKLPRLVIGVLTANEPACAAYRRASYVFYEHWLEKHVSAAPAPARPVEGLSLRSMTRGDRGLMLRFLKGIADDEARYHWAMRPGSDISMAEVDRMVEEIADEDGIVTIAELDGKPVGYAAIVCETAEEEYELRDDWVRRGYITDMYVAPEGRRRGVAMALLGALEAHIVSRGLDWLLICVSPRNAPALALYEKAGFGPYELVLEKRL